MKKGKIKKQNKTGLGKESLTLDQIEERLVKTILSGTLALHILRNTRKPLSELTKELFDIEAAVGEFVGQAMQSKLQAPGPVNLKGVLVNALSFVPISMSLDSRRQIKNELGMKPE